jgi:PST family polysaccharide transporter
MTGLNRTVAVAARWSLLNTVVVRLGNVVAGAILARFFLDPRDWGLYAVGSVVLAMLFSFSELGVSLALIRWEGDIRRFAPTVLTISTVSGLILYGLLWVGAPSISRLLGSADATPVVRLLCFAVVIGGVACVPMARLTREFQQGKRMIVDLANFVVSTGVTMGLAATGAGAISFAWGAVAGMSTALAFAAVLAPGMLRFGWNQRQAGELLRFGLPLAGASMLVLATVNVDSMVVGATLGPVALGLYQIASNMSGWPVRTISEAARRVSFAGFSRLAASKQALADGYCAAFGMLMAAAVPVCALLGTLAEPVIDAVYGPKWVGAAVALRFLAVLGLIRVAYELTYDCLVAADRRKALVLLQAWWLAALVPVLLLFGNAFGIAGVAAGHVVVGLVLVAPLFVLMLSRVGIPPGRVARAAARPFLGGAVVVVVAWAVYEPIGNFFGLLLASAAAMAAYVPFVWPLIRRSRKAPRHALTKKTDLVLAATGTDQSGES